MAILSTISQPASIWMLVACGLILLMALPGLVLFYGGQVRRKNVLSTMMSVLAITGVLSLLWGLLGYSLIFANSPARFIGGFEFALFFQLDSEWEGKPRMLHLLFQMGFFCLTPAILCGSVVERVRFGPLLLFSVLWALVVYCPIAHWMWSPEGWLGKDGFGVIDAAGGVVVHFAAGVSGLVAAMLIGKRLAYGQEPMPPHHLPFVVLGTCLLWLGWFGFNSGNAWAGEAPFNRVVESVATTHFGAAAGMLTWIAFEWWMRSKPTILGACSGVLAGLVCVTPGAGYLCPLSSVFVGACGAAIAFLACSQWKNRFGYDDTLDVFGIHGIAGAAGTILVGIVGRGGMIDANFTQILVQLFGLLIVGLWAALGTLLILRVLDRWMSLRVRQQDELRGLDVTQHGQEGYNT